MYPTSHSTSSSRGPSLEYGSRGPSLDSAASDPFVDRSLYDPSLSSAASRTSSRSSSRVRPGPPATERTPGRNPWSPLSSEHGDSPPPSTTTSRPEGVSLTTTEDLSRQISAAVSEDLPPPSRESSPPPAPAANGSGRNRSESSATIKARNGGGGGYSSNSGSGQAKASAAPSFLSQFRSGSGWFAPMVEPERPLSREEYAQKEKERIERLKAGKSAKRPGLMKRLSSGLELSGFGGGSGGNGGSPTKR
ncbi:hypothetical protein JCM11491_000087 [Sporobolomyces phaffii]